MKVALRSITEDSGGQFAMISGTILTPRLCAGSWDAVGSLRLQVVLTLGKAQVISCWTMCSAMEMRPPCFSVNISDGGYTTVPTMKMLVLSVQVLSCFSFLNTFAVNCTQYTCMGIGVWRHSPSEIIFHLFKTYGGKLYQIYQVHV